MTDTEIYVCKGSEKFMCRFIYGNNWVDKCYEAYPGRIILPEFLIFVDIFNDWQESEDLQGPGKY